MLRVSASDGKKRNRSERGSDVETYDSSEDEATVREPATSRLAKRQRHARERRSGLSKQVNLNSTDSTTEDDKSQSSKLRRKGKSADSSVASTPQRQDIETEANDSDFLDDLAGELDDEID